MSTLHGGHQVAQKFSRTTLPRKSERRTGLPEASARVKSGAICKLPAGCTFVWLGQKIRRIALVSPTQASMQRSAKTRVAGKAIRHVTVTADAASAITHRRV